MTRDIRAQTSLPPFKKPPGGELLKWQKEFNAQVNKLRAPVERRDRPSSNPGVFFMPITTDLYAQLAGWKRFTAGDFVDTASKLNRTGPLAENVIPKGDKFGIYGVQPVVGDHEARRIKIAKVAANGEFSYL